jgi:hypothetical protein
VDNLQWLVKTYFSDPAKRIQVKKGETLLDQNDTNQHLFLVRRGCLKGYMDLADGTRVETFEATRNMFIGAPSFFSKTYSSLNTVIAVEDSELQYIHSDQEVIPHEFDHSQPGTTSAAYPPDIAGKRTLFESIDSYRENGLAG